MPSLPVAPEPQDFVMRFKLIALLFAVPFSACSPSGGQEKGGKGHPGAGMPPPEVNAMSVELRPVPVSFEYVGQTAGSREVEVRARVTGILHDAQFQGGRPGREGPVAVHHRPGAVPGRAGARRGRRRRGARRARSRRARNAARFKPLYAEQAVSQKEYDDAVSAEADRRRRPEGRARAAHRGAPDPRLHQGRVAGRRHRRQRAALRGLAGLRPRRAAHQRDADRPDLGELRHPGQRRGAPAEGGRSRAPGCCRRAASRCSCACPTARCTRKSGRLNFSDVRVNPRHRHARGARRAAQPQRRRAAPGPVRARDPEGRDDSERRHGAAARGAREPAGRQVRLRQSTRRAAPSRARSRWASGRATTGSSPRASRRATR